MVTGVTDRAGGRLRLLMPHTVLSSFIRADIDMLRTVHDVRLVPCRSLGEILQSVVRASSCDAVVCWFGSTRYLPLAASARMMGRKVVIISGGYDVAAMPALDYGNMYHRWSRMLGRALFRLADAVASISASAAEEARVNAGVDTTHSRVIYLGLDPALGAEAPAFADKDALVLTVGHADQSSIVRKGILTAVRIARLLPDVQFVVAGPAQPQAMRILEAEAGPNVRFEGAVSWTRLCELFSAAQVYVQPSRHEAFGYSVAEAMLHNCLPVVTRCFSLPEVVGGAGLYVEVADDLVAWASAIRTALNAPMLSEQPRARVLTMFPAERRRGQLLQLLSDVCEGGADGPGG
jgi:glycosyltransferase involved in cell wall biosynthesis